LQKHTLDKIEMAGGFARLSCPETIEQDLLDLVRFANIHKPIDA
jgi:hypothetical protein